MKDRSNGTGGFNETRKSNSVPDGASHALESTDETHSQPLLIDVDGILAGPYKSGTRALRLSTQEALSLLAQHAPVFPSSITGTDN